MANNKKAKQPKPELTKQPKLELELNTQSVTEEELNTIKSLRDNSTNLTAAAEKSFTKAKMADLQVQNFILKIFNKYSMSLEGGDNILDDGTIIRNTKGTE